MSGSVVLTDGRCVLRDITAGHAGGNLYGSGRVDWSDDATRADVKIAVRNLPLDEPLREAVPWQVRKSWNNWQPAGQVSLDVDRLRYVKTKDKAAIWDVNGSLAAKLKKVVMSVDIRDAAVKADGTVRIDENRNTFSGRGTVSADKATVSMIPMAGVHGVWVAKPDGSMRLNNFRARSLGGIVAGFFEVEPTLQGDRYGIVLTLDDGDPSQLAHALSGGQMSGLKGTIQTQLRMRGLSDHPETRTGSLNLRLEGQGLYRLPVLLQLANVLDIPVPADLSHHEPQQVTARLTIMADKAIIDGLELHDRSFIMRGNGLIDLPSRKADLTVIAARPRVWPTLPLFSELLEGTVRELIEVHGTGTLDHLKFEAQPLRSLQAALQTLANPHHRTKMPKIPWPDETSWQKTANEAKR